MLDLDTLVKVTAADRSSTHGGSGKAVRCFAQTDPGANLLADAAVGAAVREWVEHQQSVYLTPAYPYDSKAYRCVVWEQGADEDDEPLREGDGPTLDTAIRAALGEPA